MTRAARIAIACALLVAGSWGLAWDGTAAADAPPTRPLLVMTGWVSEIAEPRWRLAASQAVFDEEWMAHMGDRVQRAAQGWPMTPSIDFTACQAIFIFGGDGFNANGFRVEQMVEAADALTIRFDRISFQTSSSDGPDHGHPARPWAVVVVPRTDRTVILEENVQGLIGEPPVWKRRAAFPGRIGVGRTVPGTGQTDH